MQKKTPSYNTPNRREGRKAFKQYLQRAKRKSENKYIHSRRFKLVDVYARNENTLFESRKEECLKDFVDFISPGTGSISIAIPSNFSLCANYDESLLTIKEFASSIYDYPNFKITLDFSKCGKADVAALFLMQIIRLEMIERLERFQNKINFIKIIPEFILTMPKSSDVCRLLLTSGYPIDPDKLSELEADTGFNPTSTLGYYKGSSKQKHYTENRKAFVQRK